MNQYLKKSSFVCFAFASFSSGPIGPKLDGFTFKMSPEQRERLVRQYGIEQDSSVAGREADDSTPVTSSG